jgi:CRISPR-associated protein Cas6
MDVADASLGFTETILPIVGAKLPRHYAQVLYAALLDCQPWMAQDERLAVLPLKLAGIAGDQAMLSPRTRLVIRADRGRELALRALGDTRLTVGAHQIQLGKAHSRDLQAHATVYAYRVAAASADEIAFMAGVEKTLADMGVTGHCVCGKHQTLRVDAEDINTFSVMVHGLNPAHSLCLQAQGVGPLRGLGCGVFVPHKSAAAVGA